MLSILIPIYNYDVTELVTELHRQATITGVPFEIILVEDGSVKFIAENDLLRDLPHVTHEVLERNIGRSAIRNKLAEMAQYDYLLFLDCDAKVIRDDYVQRYLDAAQPEMVMYGSIVYADDVDMHHSLRLKYGLHNESNEERAHFTTFHFMIGRELFRSVGFDECIVRYGHEDLVFRHTLRERGVVLKRIDNPLMHCGIDTNNVYLMKIKDSCKNLYDIYKGGRYPHLQDDSQLLRLYLKMERLHLVGICSVLFKTFGVLLRWQLSSHTPSLFLFKCYKLGCMCAYARDVVRHADIA